MPENAKSFKLHIHFLMKKQPLLPLTLTLVCTHSPEHTLQAAVIFHTRLAVVKYAAYRLFASASASSR